MEGATVLQMDKTTLENQIILGNEHECGQNTGLFCNYYL
jgi:hypothetical protein